MTFTASTGIYGILRSHDRQTFTTIDNQTLQNDSLSYKATGFLTKLLSLPPNWKIQVNDLMSRFGMGRYSVLQRLKELQEAGYLIRQKVKDEMGRFFYIHIIRETPTTVGKIDGGLGGEVLEASDSSSSSIVRFSVGGESVGGESNLLINNNSIKERTIKDPLTSDSLIPSGRLRQRSGNPTMKANQDTEQVEGDFVTLSYEPEALETPSSEPTSTQPLVKSETLEEANFPAACDNLKLGNREEVIGNSLRSKSEPITCYQIQLAAIGIAIQNVEWIIKQIPKQERDRVVSDAIAWVSEQKWVEQPAAAFVSAIRGRKKSAKLVDEELKQIINTHQTEAQQFSQWYAIAKRCGRVEYSQGSQEHYALVTLPDGVTMPWHQARDYLAVLMAADDELEI